MTTKAHGSGLVAGFGVEVSSTEAAGDVPSTAADSDASTEPSKHPRDGPSAAKRRLLVIDDEAPLIRVIERLMRDWDVVGVADGTEALDKLSNDAFDAILCDLMMPGMSGPELHRTLSNTMDVPPPMGFMTGGAFTASAQTFLREVDPPVLRKPFSRAQLRAFLADLVPE